MPNKIKPEAKCPHCGSTNFFVHEFTYYKASADEDEPHIINCFVKGNGINMVECAECEKDITDLSLEAGIEFNFQ